MSQDVPDPTTLHTNKATRLDFSRRAAKIASQGFVFVRDFGNFASDYLDLYGSELQASDYIDSSLSNLSTDDIAVLVAAYPKIDEILSANDGLVRKAVKRLAQFDR